MELYIHVSSRNGGQTKSESEMDPIYDNASSPHNDFPFRSFFFSSAFVCHVRHCKSSRLNQIDDF